MKKALLALGVLTASCAGFYGLADAAQTVIGTTTLKSGQALTVACSGTKLRITRISATASAERCWGRAATATRPPPTTAITQTAGDNNHGRADNDVQQRPDVHHAAGQQPRRDTWAVRRLVGHQRLKRVQHLRREQCVHGQRDRARHLRHISERVVAERSGWPPDNGGVQAYPDVAQQMNDWGSEGGTRRCPP